MKTYKDARKQLDIIQGLALLWDNGPRTLKQADFIIKDVYKFAHINGSCKNLHIGWEREMRQAEKELKKMGII